MLQLKIAARFLRSSRAQTALIIAGIAVGIAVQIFVGSLITSLQANLVDQTVGGSTQVTITALEDGDPVSYTSDIREALEAEERIAPDAIAPVRTLSALFDNPDGDSASLNLKAGNLVEIDPITNLTARTVEGVASLEDGEIMVGTDFAEKYGLTPGDDLDLIFAGNRTVNLQVSGIFDLGSAAVNERQAFIAPELARDLLGWADNEFSAIETRLDDPFDSAAVTESLRGELDGVTVVDWQEQNADLLTALQSQASSSYMIQAFVLIAVALGIASTLAISAVQKTRQIGILKAMGMGDRAAGRIFLFQAAILGVGGSLAGLVLGWLLIWSFSFVPVSFSITIQPGFAALSAGIGIVVALVSSIIPTRSTSRLDPIEVIQGG